MERRTGFERNRRRGVVAAAGALVLAGGGVVAVLAATGSEPLSGPAGSAPSPTSPTPTSTAPAAPPAQICGNRETLDGPATPPAGAVTVRTGQNLNDVTKAQPPGSTFWLAPGVHRLTRHQYGQVIPKDGNTYLGAPGAILDGQRINRYAFIGYATKVTIKHLTVQNFGKPRGTNDQGVVNHDAGAGWVVERNTIWKNSGAGVMIGSRNQIRHNCLADNGQYGFNAYHEDGVSTVVVEHNEIARNNTDDWEKVRPGCGCSGGGKFWAVAGAVVRDNWVHHNKSAGLWADTNNRGFSIAGNYISDNDAEGIIYETSYNASIRDNTFVRNGLAKGPGTQGFPTGAVYVSESGSDPRVPGGFGQAFEISHNVFQDNWAGVILWENSDRFAGSPANLATETGTLVNPAVASARSCNASTIRSKPFVDDCRWKTQNVRVHHNQFSIDPDEIGKTCASRTLCGFNGLFANWGTFPDWSPYQERVVQEAITFKQGNRFYANTYTGPWQFVVHEQGKLVNWATWQGAPYSQDHDSVVKVER